MADYCYKLVINCGTKLNYFFELQSIAYIYFTIFTK